MDTYGRLKQQYASKQQGFKKALASARGELKKGLHKLHARHSPPLRVRLLEARVKEYKSVYRKMKQDGLTVRGALDTNSMRDLLGLQSRRQ